MERREVLPDWLRAYLDHAVLLGTAVSGSRGWVVEWVDYWPSQAEAVAAKTALLSSPGWSWADGRLSWPTQEAAEDAAVAARAAVAELNSIGPDQISLRYLHGYWWLVWRHPAGGISHEDGERYRRAIDGVVRSPGLRVGPCGRTGFGWRLLSDAQEAVRLARAKLVP